VYQFNVSGLTVGTYIYKWYANDTLGNENSTAQLSYSVQDTVPPLLQLIQPTNTTYYIVGLNYSVSDPNLDKCWYSLGSGNISITGCNNLTTVGDYGFNQLWLWANDTLGNENGTSINFTINSPPIFDDPRVNPETGSWSTNFTFSLNVSDIDGDNVTVVLQTSSDNSTWQNRTTIICTGCRNASVNISQIFACQDLGVLYYRFSVNDGYYMNYTSGINMTIEQGVLNSVGITSSGVETTGARGKHSVNVSVRIWDVNASIYPDDVDMKIWFNTSRGLLETNCTTLSGYCTVSVDPDCSFYANTSYFAGVVNDECYADVNSSAFYMRVDKEAICTRRISFVLDNISGDSYSGVDYSCKETNGDFVGIAFSGQELYEVKEMEITQFSYGNRFLIPVSSGGCGNLQEKLLTGARPFFYQTEGHTEISVSYSIDIVGDESARGDFIVDLEKSGNQILAVVR
jgi:hypothetical protein